MRPPTSTFLQMEARGKAQQRCHDFMMAGDPRNWSESPSLTSFFLFQTLRCVVPCRRKQGDETEHHCPKSLRNGPRLSFCSFHGLERTPSSQVTQQDSIQPPQMSNTVCRLADTAPSSDAFRPLWERRNPCFPVGFQTQKGQVQTWIPVCLAPAYFCRWFKSPHSSPAMRLPGRCPFT